MACQPITTSQHIAFLRAINVGGRTVTMERLRELFELLGCSGVETFIASGNVIFRSPEQDTGELERRIESHLQDALGYHVATFIRTPSELAAIATRQPFATAASADDGLSLHIAFLRGPLEAESKRRLLAYQTPDDQFHAHEREVYWLRRGRLSDSSFSGAILEKAIGMPATLRNANTVRKLAAKYAAS